MTFLDTQITDNLNDIIVNARMNNFVGVVSDSDDIVLDIDNYNHNTKRPEAISQDFRNAIATLVSDADNAQHENLSTIYGNAIKNHDIPNLRHAFNDMLNAEQRSLEVMWAKE